ncbi:hypothetical protein KKG51_00025, partial [Patescibacteria group bacterium]|nr:hypothetical protein [Patescibacteria group bacterium]
DKKPLDKDGWSILQRADKPQEGRSRIIDLDGLVSGGDCDWGAWCTYLVYFNDYSPIYPFDRVRLRHAVMKNS